MQGEKFVIFMFKILFSIKGRTCKILAFHDFWFKFYDKFCSPCPIVDFLRIFNHQNRKQ